MTTQDLTVAQAVAYAVLYALETEAGASWKTWAHIWLKGDDRSATSAHQATGMAETQAARHAAMAARLLAEACQFQTEAAMLASENRNALWQMDQCDQRQSQCLHEVTESLHASTSASPPAPDCPRDNSLRARVVREF